jgi:hypothetical protein
MTTEDLFERWRRAQKAAVDAEAALRDVGQAAADPRIAQLALEAARLRREEDELLAEILRQSGARPPAAG